VNVDLVRASARMIAGGALIVAGTLKLVDLEDFARVLQQFPGLGVAVRRDAAARAVAAALVVAELMSGSAYFLGLRPILSGGVVTILLLTFASALLVALATGRSIRCGCFGKSSSDPVTWRGIVRNVILAAIAYVGMADTGATLDRAFGGFVSWARYLTAEMIGLQVAVLFVLILAYMKLVRTAGYQRHPLGRPPVGELKTVWEGARAPHVGFWRSGPKEGAM
jgi:hypothetical protein